MANKLLKLVILIFMIVGIWYGVSITIKREIPKYDQKSTETKVLNMIQTKTAETTSIYTYGRALNLSGKISNISKDNFESARLYITDGLNYEQTYNLNYSFEGNNLVFSSSSINSGLIIDELENSEYYVLLRLKVNNSIEPKYYSFHQSSGNDNIEYYTVTKNDTNKKASISFFEKDYNNKKYNLLTLKLEDTNLPDDVYDIVIDAGHGGTDTGEKSGETTEAALALSYSKDLKEKLENMGYKVKLTRDDSNSSEFSATNMYDANGRISIACKAKAKLMISFHVNNDANNRLSGLEIYSPCKSNLEFAIQMANKINEYSGLSFSNNNSFKQSERCIC